MYTPTSSPSLCIFFKLILWELSFHLLVLRRTPLLVIFDRTLCMRCSSLGGLLALWCVIENSFICWFWENSFHSFSHVGQSNTMDEHTHFNKCNIYFLTALLFWCAYVKYHYCIYTILWRKTKPVSKHGLLLSCL